MVVLLGDTGGIRCSVTEPIEYCSDLLTIDTMFGVARVLKQVGCFRLTMVSALFVLIYYYLAGFIPGIARVVTGLWFVSLISVLILCVVQAVLLVLECIRKEFRALRLGMLLVSIVSLYLLYMYPCDIAITGVRTRVILYGGSEKLRDSMVSLFDAYPLSEHDYKEIDSQPIKKTIKWVNRPIFIYHDRITFGPRFPVPLRGVWFVIMKDAYDRPEEKGGHMKYVNFGNGLWLVLPECGGNAKDDMG